MKLLTRWLREYLAELPVDDRQLAEDLTLRGIAVEGEFPVAGGTLFDMDITTNRVDAMNHYGAAREAAVIYGVALKTLDVALSAAKARAALPVRIEAKDLCGRFTARVIRGVTVGASSGVVAEYFDALGQKRIFAPVDATNFGWLAMGHPTHAFDLDKIEGGIIVRRAHRGEKLKLLDETERVLDADDLVIADEKKALGLAGVMGGWESRVTEATKNILVEAAWFEPATIRRSSRRHGLHTDASHRFERGADFAAAPTANAFVSKLILEQCGGAIEGELVDVLIPEAEARTAKRTPIALSVAEVQRHLGRTQDEKGIGAALIEHYLSALGCKLKQAGDGRYAVTLPSWRLDLEREIDLIEEVARVHGYNKFADTLPAATSAVVELPTAVLERTARSNLLAGGWSEAISSTFCSAEDAAKFAEPNESAVAMGNPLSEEAGMLRPSLVPSMLTMLAHNLNRDVAEVQLFEMGTVFTGSTAQVHERPGLALGAAGGAAAGKLYGADDALFYEMKGAIEALLALFDVGAVTFAADGLPAWLEAGRAARVVAGGETLAWFGELSAAESRKRKLRQTVCVAEVQLAALLKRPLRQPVAGELSRFQAVERDLSLLFSDSVRWEKISSAISALGIAELVHIAPVEIFRDAKGKAVPAGSYSVLVRVVFQSVERTLVEEELTSWSARIVDALTKLGGTLRG